jgi:hypothetical protein
MCSGEYGQMFLTVGGAQIIFRVPKRWSRNRETFSILRAGPLEVFISSHT